MSTGLFERRDATGVWWRDHSLSLVLAAILLAQTVYVVLVGHAEWVTQQADHGAAAAGWPRRVLAVGQLRVREQPRRRLLRRDPGGPSQ
jgi:hypothetical protein